MKRIFIIGIGYKPLDKKIVSILKESYVILASDRLMEVFSHYKEFSEFKGKIKVINTDVSKIIAYIKNFLKNFSNDKLSLLASGDPMFFGIGKRIIKEFGKNIVEIIPDLSCIQLAFSKIKESWDDAHLISLHGKAINRRYELNDLPILVKNYKKLAILTDKQNSPTSIAKVLLETNEDLSMYVCERLGYYREMIYFGTPKEFAKKEFLHPNLVIVINKNFLKKEIVFGLQENEIKHLNGMITKDEIRAVVLHKLRLPMKGVFWDIGAGSGSISLEAAKISPLLKVYAIEKNPKQIEIIEKNKFLIGIKNIEIVNAEAPEFLNGLPEPDRVFIGGSSGKLEEIINFLYKKGVSIIVLTITTLENLQQATKLLEKNYKEVDISEIIVARSKSVGKKRYLKAMNPIFVLRVRK